MDKILFDSNTNLALSASAGTGKTRALSLRFLDLYVKYENISSIYALTFTNKASGEMQERIVHYLNILSNPEKFPQEEEIAQLFSPRFKDITQKAHKLKHGLLSDFSDFNVSTIHSFLNSILKTIPFQTNVLPDFTIIEAPEENILIGKVIDEFLQDAVNNPRDKMLINKVLSNKYRNTKKTIKDMFLSLLPRMLEIREIFENLEKSEEQFAPDVSRLKRDCFKIIALLKNDNFYNNKNLERKIGTLARLLEDTEEEKLIEEIMELFEKKYFKKLEENPDTGQAFKNLISSINRQAKEFALSNNRRLLFYNLKLFFAIYDKFQDIKKDSNVVTFTDLENYALKALSDSQIKEYLYFKSSSQIEHLLIDEFQDTSIIQWKILEPIAEEVTAGQNHSFFYVGDPNQAIYRFRGGESRLFNHIKNKFPGKIRTEYLTKNYRSKEEIVNFINDIFSSAEGHKPMQSMQKQGGWVVVENMGEHGQKEGTRIVREKAVQAIKTLIKNGYHYNDIALLVRKNQTGIKLSESLEEAGIPTQSESKSPLLYQEGVRDIINLLRWLTNPCEDFYLSLALLSPLFSIGEKTLETLKTKKDCTLFENLKTKYMHRQITEKLQELLKICDFLSPYELISFIYSLLNIMKNYKYSGTFSALLELAYKFETETGTSLSSFVEYLQKHGQTLEFSENEINGVQILTCHKAKGLEFPVVLLSETVWNMEGAENDQFVFEYLETDSELALKNIYYRKDPLLKLFQKEIFQDEKRRSYNDELNNLYVAMTRAKEGLWIIGYQNNRLPKTWFEFISKSEKIQFKNNIYSAGKIQTQTKPPQKTRKISPKIEKFNFHNTKRHKITVSPEEKPIISDEQRDILRWGEICHYALSKIEKINESNLEETVRFAIDNTQKVYARSHEEQKEISDKLAPVLKDILTDRDLEFIFN
ncbi:MAG: UvrD-helicase domain-containing protein, partial [Candidatus Ratteibacteria bacterium]|nr:UvrD-helicase domain-containing protein [Candidatus Ratteibacteria bacterium]